MAKEPKTASPDFLATLDTAAAALLAQAGLSDNLAESGNIMDEGGDASANLAEKVKAFQAVTAWAEKRVGLLPPPPKEGTKFERLQSKFRQSSPRGGADSAAEPGPLEAGGNGDE